MFDVNKANYSLNVFVPAFVVPASWYKIVQLYKTDIVSIKVKPSALGIVLNSDIAHDFEFPQQPQITPFFAFCMAIYSFVIGEPTKFKCSTLIYHIKSYPVDDKSSLKRA